MIHEAWRCLGERNKGCTGAVEVAGGYRCCPAVKMGMDVDWYRTDWTVSWSLAWERHAKWGNGRQGLGLPSPRHVLVLEWDANVRAARTTGAEPTDQECRRAISKDQQSLESDLLA